ncbi:hypothetical protein S245_041851 [Arachis hypogaea]
MVLFKIAGAQIVPEIDMYPNETIFDLKDKIEEKLGVGIHRQALWYQETKLKDEARIRDYGFHCDTTLILTVTPLPPDLKLHVLVKFNGSNGYVRVRETDKVSDLRRKVEKYWAIPQQLFALRRFKVEMKDSYPLSAYYVTDDSDVELAMLLQPR